MWRGEDVAEETLDDGKRDKMSWIPVQTQSSLAPAVTNGGRAHLSLYLCVKLRLESESINVVGQKHAKHTTDRK